MAPDRHGATSDTEALATTIGLYVLGEISLGKAAERLGVSRWKMGHILASNGVDPRLGPADMDEALREHSITLREAADLADVSYVELLTRTTEAGIDVGYTTDDLDRDLERI